MAYYVLSDCQQHSRGLSLAITVKIGKRYLCAMIYNEFDPSIFHQDVNFYLQEAFFEF
jgi:hypothetical protein